MNSRGRVCEFSRKHLGACSGLAVLDGTFWWLKQVWPLPSQSSQSSGGVGPLSMTAWRSQGLGFRGARGEEAPAPAWMLGKTSWRRRHPKDERNEILRKGDRAEGTVRKEAWRKRRAWCSFRGSRGSSAQPYHRFQDTFWSDSKGH